MSKIVSSARPRKSRRAVWLLPIVLAALIGLFATLRAMAAVPHLGYGFNVAEWDITRIQALGFNWIKVFDVPPSPLPVRVLLRVDVNAQTTSMDLLNDLTAKLVYKNNIDAWEIGNEPNLDANYGWNAPPDPVGYKNILCAAYTKIKTVDPEAIVVSAGLAPVGRVITVPGNPIGSNGQFQDERKFLEQLLKAGGGSCLDVVGYHPYGFSADYNAVPDVFSTDSTQNCEQGFCFRGAEKLYAVMQANGLGDKKMWATEFGWLVTPPNNCLGDPSFNGRTWQLVSADKQASNLAGAFQYADANYPWMGAMFIFNLNFDSAPWITNQCDQMRYYSIQPQAESALTSLIKNVADIPARLKSNKSIDLMIQTDRQPMTLSVPFPLSNWGWQTLRYTATANNSLNVVPSLPYPVGVLSPTQQLDLPLFLTSTDRSHGVYTGSLTIAASPGTLGAPRNVSINLWVVDHVYRTYLPLVALNSSP